MTMNIYKIFFRKATMKLVQASSVEEALDKVKVALEPEDEVTDVYLHVRADEVIK